MLIYVAVILGTAEKFLLFFIIWSLENTSRLA